MEGQVVAGRVFHVPFVQVVYDVFVLVFEAPLHMGHGGLLPPHVVERGDDAVEIVAGVVHIMPGTQYIALHSLAIVVAHRLAQAVIAFDVEVLAFHGIEETGRQVVPGMGGGLVGPGERAEIGGKAVYLKAVEIYPERFGVARGAEFGLLALGGELVSVVRDVAEQFKVVPFIGSVGEQHLEIGEGGFVFAPFIERLEYQLRIFLTDTGQIGELLVLGRSFYMQMSAHKTQAY